MSCTLSSVHTYMKLQEVIEGIKESWNNEELEENSTLTPEIFQISSYSTFHQKMGNISRCIEANTTTNIPLERSHQVVLGLQFARDLARQFARKCAFEFGGRGRRWVYLEVAWCQPQRVKITHLRSQTRVEILSNKHL